MKKKIHSNWVNVLDCRAIDDSIKSYLDVKWIFWKHYEILFYGKNVLWEVQSEIRAGVLLFQEQSFDSLYTYDDYTIYIIQNPPLHIVYPSHYWLLDSNLNLVNSYNIVVTQMGSLITLDSIFVSVQKVVL